MHCYVQTKSGLPVIGYFFSFLIDIVLFNQPFHPFTLVSLRLTMESRKSPPKPCC